MIRILWCREYKEALRQQRNQDSHAIYRPKETATTSEETSPTSTHDSPSSQISSFKSNTSTPSSTNAQSTTSSNTNSPLSPRYSHNSSIKYISPTNPLPTASTTTNGSNESVNNAINSNGSAPVSLKSPLRNEKPIQKVTPSRNSTPIKYQVTSPTNGNAVPCASSIKTNLSIAKDCNAYVKPNSPAKPNTISANGSPINAQNIAKTNGTPKAVAQKSPR